MKFDGDVLFELPPICKPMGVSKYMQNMDIKYDNHDLVQGENDQH
jgi:hypothetical protein